MFYFELFVFIYSLIPLVLVLVCLIMWLFIKFAKFIKKTADAELSIPDEEKNDSFASDAGQTVTDIYDPEKDEKAKKELYQSLFAIILGLAIGISLGIYLFS